MLTNTFCKQGGIARNRSLAPGYQCVVAFLEKRSATTLNWDNTGCQRTIDYPETDMLEPVDPQSLGNSHDCSWVY